MMPPPLLGLGFWVDYVDYLFMTVANAFGAMAGSVVERFF
jgi:hypothetical protein